VSPLEQLLNLLLAALTGVLVISLVWLLLVQRIRARQRMQRDQLVLLRREIEEYHLHSVELLSLAHRHLPQGRRPELAREALPALDRAIQEWQAELKEIHRRLVVNLHVVAQLRKSEQHLSGRVVELEQMLMESSEYELRARFRAVSSERDFFRNQLIELRQALAPGHQETIQQIATLNKHNEVLRGELRQSRRLLQVMERQIRMLQREGMEGAGIAYQGLLERDLPPGAFESLNDVPLEDPEEYARSEREPVNSSRNRAAVLIESAAQPPPGTPQLSLNLPTPIAPVAPDMVFETHVRREEPMEEEEELDQDIELPLL
jgi:hypothetical protein